MSPLNYYRTIARGNPGGLAKAAARRAGRMIRNRLSRPDEPPDEARLLIAFGIQDPSTLADRIFAARPNVIAEAGSVRVALDRVEGARVRALIRAEEAADRRFRVFGTEVRFEPGTPIDWSLDAGSGRSFPMIAANDPALLQPGMDPKFPWALGRLDSLIALGQGFIAASDPAQRDRLATEFIAQTTDFLLANPCGVGVHWLCPMEVALRAANLAIALLMFGGAEAVRAPSFLLLVLRCLSEHALFVEHHLENQGAVPNNHLVSNLTGLLVVSALFPELPHSPRHAALAVNGLREEIARQVHEDGVSFEGSVPYHRLSTELFTLAWLAARRHGFDLGERYADRLHKMFRFAAAYCSERGLAPQLGDNDSGRALPLADRSSLDHGYLSPWGAALFADPSLHLSGAAFPDEALWTLGAAGLDAFGALPGSAPVPVFSSAPGSVHLLRAGDAVLTVCAGPKGQRGVGGHNHHDQLSFELHVRGVPVIVDPGTAQYTRDPAQRNFFRSTAAHNTVQVDERELGPLDADRLFALVDPHPAEVTALLHGERLARLDVETRAYSPVTVRRSFLIDVPARALCVVDRLEGSGVHLVQSRLHLPDGALWERPATEAELRRAAGVPFAPRELSERAFVLGPKEAPRAVVLVEADVTPRVIPAAYSPGYGELREAKALVLEREGALPARTSVVVLFG